jgi:hypothetical protein
MTGPSARSGTLSTCTMHHAPYAIHHAPCNIHHALCTIHHAPCTMHHTPYAIRHTPYAIHHTPCTTHHTPCTIPYTMHHTPCTMRHAPYTMHHTYTHTLAHYVGTLSMHCAHTPHTRTLCRYIEYALDHASTLGCLANHVETEAAVCGNGVLEEGEECDIGSLSSPCCDSSTCMLTAGSQCSAEQACCEESCQFKSASAVCREGDVCDSTSRLLLTHHTLAHYVGTLSTHCAHTPYNTVLTL